MFLRHVKTEVEVDWDGNSVGKSAPVCYTFDSLEEAERFCQKKVEHVEALLCEIYDRRGKIYPLRSFTHSRHAHRLPNRASAWRKILIAVLLLMIAPALFWLDYRRDGMLIVPTVVGFACIVTAGRLIGWASGEFDRARENETKS